jgi:hypothetical protein
MKQIIATLIVLLLPFIYAFFTMLTYNKRWKIYDAKQLRKDKNNDRYIKHFIIWIKDVLKKQKVKYNYVTYKINNKKFPFQLKINNYECEWKFKDKEIFRFYLCSLKEGILLGQKIFKRKK